MLERSARVPGLLGWAWEAVQRDKDCSLSPLQGFQVSQGRLAGLGVEQLAQGALHVGDEGGVLVGQEGDQQLQRLHQKAVRCTSLPPSAKLSDFYTTGSQLLGH